MNRVTIKTLLLILFSTWVCVLVQIFMARQTVPDMAAAFESMGARLPPLSQIFCYFLISPNFYILPVLGSLAVVLIEIIVKSERSRLFFQIAYTCLWLVFITLNYIALFLPILKMQSALT